MGDTIRLYDPDLLQFDRIRAKMLEEPNPGPEQKGCDADLDLVELSRAQ